MNISSRGTGTIEEKYKNKFWKLFFSIKLTKKLFPVLKDRKTIKTITDFKVISYDIMDFNNG